MRLTFRWPSPEGVVYTPGMVRDWIDGQVPLRVGGLTYPAKITGVRVEAGDAIVEIEVDDA